MFYSSTLILIRDIWIEENYDWEDSVSMSLEEVGLKVDFERQYNLVFNIKDKELLKSLCKQEGVDPELIGRILNTEILNNKPSGRRKVLKDIKKIFTEEWRDEKTILQQIREENKV